MKYLIGNWKSNFKFNDLKPYFKELNDSLELLNLRIKTMLALPNIWLVPSIELVNNKIELISQNIDQKDAGSYTGSINLEMLTSLNIKTTILGHSEERKFLNETNAIINKKIIDCLDKNMCVILCIGEPKSIYDNQSTLSYLKNEIDNLFKDVTNINQENLIIAYEPLWAIGTGLTPTINEIDTLINELKKHLNNKYNLNLNILYGGSVNLTNINDFLQLKNVDGFLIGNLSLKPKEFIKIIAQVNQKNS